MDTNDIIWPSPAKLNLFLRICGRRDDGYHNLQSIFQLTDYMDELRFIPRQDNQWISHYQYPGITQSNDLIRRAVKLIQSYAIEQSNDRERAFGLDIYCEKKIPMGGGLGGGSSNAATTLMALNYLWQVNLSEQQLLQMAASLGADVPIFVYGQTAWAEGIGEKLTALEMPQKYFLVIVPQLHISTEKLFADKQLQREQEKIDFAQFKQSSAGNTFEPIVRKNYPQINQAMQWLEQYSQAYLTGTGACVFSIFEQQQQAQAVYQQLPKNWSAFICQACQQSPLHQLLDSLTAC